MSAQTGDPARFLMALGQALSTATLYSGDHPSREKAAEVLFGELQSLLQYSPKPRFTFLGNEVVFGRMSLRALRDWSLGPRLSKSGVQWLELSDAVTVRDLRGFIEDVASILSSPADVPIDPLLFQRTGIRWGTVAVRKGGATVKETPVDGIYSAQGLPARSDQSHFREEVEAARWITTSLDQGNTIPLAEAQAVIRSLAIELHQGGDVLQPLFQLGSSETDSSVHAVGVSILAMAFGEYIGMSKSDVRALGVAALFHDIGLRMVDPEILASPSMLTGAELEQYRKHTEHGARMLLDAEQDMALCAVVAYEHHIRPDGTGYPAPHYQRETHKASRIVRICSSYHSRRSNKPYRPAMDGMAVLNHIEWHAGKKYDAALAVPFVTMMRDAEEKATRQA